MVAGSHIGFDVGNVRPTVAVLGRQNTSPNNLFACKIVPRSFHNIKHIGRFPIKISLFYYDTTYSLCTYNHRPCINTV